MRKTLCSGRSRTSRHFSFFWSVAPVPTAHNTLFTSKHLQEFHLLLLFFVSSLVDPSG